MNEHSLIMDNSRMKIKYLRVHTRGCWGEKGELKLVTEKNHKQSEFQRI